VRPGDLLQTIQALFVDRLRKQRPLGEVAIQRRLSEARPSRRGTGVPPCLQCAATRRTRPTGPVGCARRRVACRGRTGPRGLNLLNRK
jgi:hypothetical protein